MVTQSELPPFDWTPQGTGALVPQWTLVPICLLGECRRIWVSLSWFLNLPYWLRFWVLFGGGAGYLPPPSRKDTGDEGGVGGCETSGGIPTHGLDTEWGSVERCWGIPTQSKDTGWWAGWKMAGELPKQWKGTGRGAQLGKKIEEYPGLSWKMLRSLYCRGLNGLGWVVK